MRNNGQNLVEFLIIVAVVALGGIMILTLLGGNINEMFSQSVDKTNTYKPFDWETTSKSNSSTSSSSKTTKTITSTPASSTNVNGVNVVINTDGSASFNYGGQDVLLSANTMSDMETIIDTTGADGKEILIAMVQDMIDEHKDEYPNSDVPIEIMSGKSARTDDGGDKYAYGDAELNIVTVKVGDNFKIFQNDTGGEISGGQYILEYNADKDSNDIKITDINGNDVAIKGFMESNDDHKSEIDDFETYTDPNTGKFYIIGEGDDGPGGSGQEVLSAAGITVPQSLINNKDMSKFFDKNGQLVDRVWLLEFNPNN